MRQAVIEQTWTEKLGGWLRAPQPIERLALARILLPLVLLAFQSSRIAHADEWLSAVGFRVPDLGGDWRQPLYIPAVPVGVAWAIGVAMVVSGLSVAVGLFTRPAAAIFATLLAYVALADRLEAFTVSKLGPMLALALCLTPSGARYSLDAVLRRVVLLLDVERRRDRLALPGDDVDPRLGVALDQPRRQPRCELLPRDPHPNADRERQHAVRHDRAGGGEDLVAKPRDGRASRRRRSRRHGSGRGAGCPACR